MSVREAAAASICVRTLPSGEREKRKGRVQSLLRDEIGEEEAEEEEEVRRWWGERR